MEDNNKEDKKKKKLPDEIIMAISFSALGLLFLLLGNIGFGIFCFIGAGIGVFRLLNAKKQEKDTSEIIANRRKTYGDETVREKVDPETIKRAEEEFLASLEDRTELYKVARVYDAAVIKSESKDLTEIKEAKALFEQISDKFDVRIELDDCEAKINSLQGKADDSKAY